MELTVSSAILDSWSKDFKESLDIDVAIAGAGPSALTASYYLAKKGFKVVIFEQNLAPGGGMWGGAMMFNKIVVQKEALHILDEFQINYQPYEEAYVADSLQATSSLIYHATSQGAKIFNCVSVEDLVVKNDKVNGLVINWSPVTRQRMHVDPMVIRAKAVLDGTGHPAEICKVLTSKNKYSLKTSSGEVIGEKSLNIEEAEKDTIINTIEVFPGLFVSGMAANAVAGSCRMGPIFGGMLMSGVKAADLISESIKV